MVYITNKLYLTRCAFLIKTIVREDRNSNILVVMYARALFVVPPDIKFVCNTHRALSCFVHVSTHIFLRHYHCSNFLEASYLHLSTYPEESGQIPVTCR